MSHRLVGSILVWASVLACACGGEEAPQPPGPPPLPPGDRLPADVDALLFGSTRPCRKDTDCPSGVCYYGSCVGLLLADQRWMQETMAEALAQACANREGLRERVLSNLVRLLERSATDVAYRGRALVALEGLGARAELASLLGAEEAVIADGAAMALTRLADPLGLERTVTLTESPETGISMEALRALGSLPGDPSLRGLLRHLNPALDGRLLAAAVDGLKRLGDPRATLSLIRFLEDAPPYLRHRVAGCLLRLTGEVLGPSPRAWKNWAASRNLPPAPRVELRAFSAEADFGLPTP